MSARKTASSSSSSSSLGSPQSFSSSFANASGAMMMITGTSSLVPTADVSNASNTSNLASNKRINSFVRQQVYVSNNLYGFLLTEASLYCKKSSGIQYSAFLNKANSINKGSSSTNSTTSATAAAQDEQSLTVAAEMAAAKLERMGHSVGYRWTERLAQNKTWNLNSTQQQLHQQQQQQAQQSQSQSQQPSIMSAEELDAAIAAAVSSQQLEAVKFICKELWTEIFNKQIDKLQTNHRGVFVLKDLEMKWMVGFPAGTEESRTTAIRLLAFPCGIIRGALSNLGIPAAVACDFLADGHNVASCSFNIKIK